MKYMRATFNGNARPNSREWRSDRGVFTLMNGVYSLPGSTATCANFLLDDRR
jgi:hypothetical protein